MLALWTACALMVQQEIAVEAGGGTHSAKKVRGELAAAAPRTTATWDEQLRRWWDGAPRKKPVRNVLLRAFLLQDRRITIHRDGSASGAKGASAHRTLPAADLWALEKLAIEEYKALAEKIPKLEKIDTYETVYGNIIDKLPNWDYAHNEYTPDVCTGRGDGVLGLAGPLARAAQHLAQESTVAQELDLNVASPCSKLEVLDTVVVEGDLAVVFDGDRTVKGYDYMLSLGKSADGKPTLGGVELDEKDFALVDVTYGDLQVVPAEARKASLSPASGLVGVGNVETGPGRSAILQTGDIVRISGSRVWGQNIGQIGSNLKKAALFKKLAEDATAEQDSDETPRQVAVFRPVETVVGGYFGTSDHGVNGYVETSDPMLNFMRGRQLMKVMKVGTGNVRIWTDITATEKPVGWRVTPGPDRRPLRKTEPLVAGDHLKVLSESFPRECYQFNTDNNFDDAHKGGFFSGTYMRDEQGNVVDAKGDGQHADGHLQGRCYIQRHKPCAMTSPDACRPGTECKYMVSRLMSVEGQARKVLSHGHYCVDVQTKVKDVLKVGRSTVTVPALAKGVTLTLNKERTQVEAITGPNGNTALPSSLKSIRLGSVIAPETLKLTFRSAFRVAAGQGQPHPEKMSLTLKGGEEITLQPKIGAFTDNEIGPLLMKQYKEAEPHQKRYISQPFLDTDTTMEKLREQEDLPMENVREQEQKLQAELLFMELDQAAMEAELPEPPAV